jgi:hypothetical protein
MRNLLDAGDGVAARWRVVCVAGEQIPFLAEHIPIMIDALPGSRAIPQFNPFERVNDASDFE